MDSLVYIMGEKAEEIFAALSLSATDVKVYSKVINAFESYFIVKKNIIYERAMFNRRTQKEGESVADFITALHTLVETCEYGSLQDELLRDRIVAGVRDERLSAKLQMEADLTLERAVLYCKQSETVQKQQKALKPDVSASDSGTVERVRTQTKGRSSDFVVPSENRFRRGKSEQASSRPSRSCTWCGGQDIHARAQCPASSARCSKCKKLRHFARACKSRGIKSITADETEVDGHCFTGNVSCTSEREAWRATVSVNDRDIRFRIDTGADVTVLPAPTFKQLGASHLLKRSDRYLLGPTRQLLGLLGSVEVPVTYSSQTVIAKLYIAEDLAEPLLGLDLIERFQLLQRVNDVTSAERVNPLTEFPELFTGLSEAPHTCTLALKQDAQPFAVTSPRRIPIPLMNAVRDELSRMEKQGVISPMDEPSDWCAPIVVVPKNNGKVQICVDYTELNKSIRR